MARLTRLCIPGWPHVVLHRGHNRQPVFRDDADRARFRDILQQAAADQRVAIHAYALLTDEVRLLLTPSTADGLSRLMQAVGRRYGVAFNQRHGHRGSVWEGRFRATVIEPATQLLAAMRYVEGLLNHSADPAAEASPWSSAPHHLGQRRDTIVSDHLLYWSLGNTPFDREQAYRALAAQGLAEREARAIADAAEKGWPLGSKSFLDELASVTERRLTPANRGRRPRSIQSDPN